MLLIAIVAGSPLLSSVLLILLRRSHLLALHGPSRRPDNVGGAEPGSSQGSGGAAGANAEKPGGRGAGSGSRLGGGKAGWPAESAAAAREEAAAELRGLGLLLVLLPALSAAAVALGTLVLGCYAAYSRPGELAGAASPGWCARRPARPRDLFFARGGSGARSRARFGGGWWG